MITTIHHIKIGILLIFFLPVIGMKAQDGVKISNNPDDISYMEDVHIFTDKDLYVAGEKIWISFFLSSSISGYEAGISSLVYVEILDENNTPVIRAKFNMQEGKANGNLSLPLDMASGQYLLRAYSRWMRNYDPACFSYKNLLIINPFEKLPEKFRSNNDDKGLLSIYPEGGLIIPGEKNLVTFYYPKASRERKRNTVYLIKDSVIVDSSQTTEAGWGYIEQSFEKGADYYLSTSPGQLDKHTLSAFYKKGVKLQLEKSSVQDEIQFRIRKSIDSPEDGWKVILYKGPVILAKYLISPEPTDKIRISKKNLSPGIYRLALTDLNHNTLSERHFLLEKSESDQVNLSLDKKTFSPREKVNIKIKAESRPLQLNLAVVKSFTTDHYPGSAYNNSLPGLTEFKNLFHQDERANFNKLLAAIQGNIYSNQKNTSLTGNRPLLPEIKGSLITGKITDPESNTPLKHASLWISVVNGHNYTWLTSSDSLGNFSCITEVEGTGDLIIQPVDSSLKYEIQLENGFSNHFIPWNPPLWEIPEKELGKINNTIINMQLRNVFFSDSLTEVQKTDTGKKEFFYGEPDIEVVMEEYIELPVMEEVIREIVPFVYFRKRNNNYFLDIADKDKREFLENPLLLLDGVPVHNTNAIMLIDPLTLEKIEVIRNKYYLHDLSFNGIIHFISKEGKFTVRELQENLFRQTIQFPVQSPEFSVPDYEKEREADDPRPDFRNTLYWNPDISFTEKETVIESFFTSDDTGTYSVILEGLDHEGNQIYIEEEILVK